MEVLMEANQLAVMINELKNGGPSPFAPDHDPPMAILFQNEMEMLAGKGVTSVFGEEGLATVIVTSFRLILHLKHKRGTDLCKSFWHKVDFGSWRWEEPDGFLASSFELSKPGYDTEAVHTQHGVPARWATYFINPEGERKQIDEIVVYLTEYNFHQEGIFVPWKHEITLPLKSGETMTHTAAYMFSVKINLGSEQPGTTSLEALQMLMDDPFGASQMPGGEIPADSRMHPDKATRKVKSVELSHVASGRAGRESGGDKARRTAKKAIQVGSQVKSSVDLAKKAVAGASTVGMKAGAPNKKTTAATGSKSAKKRSQTAKSGTTPKGKSPVSKKPASPAKESAAAQQAVKTVRPQVCLACGARLKLTSLFCGKCGEKVVEKIIDEVKDKISGKVEDLAVEKIEKALDDEPKPAKKKVKPAASKQSSTRKTTPGKSPKKTSASKLEKPASKKARTSTATKSRSKCPSCGRTIQRSWSFCPNCSAALPADCPECGKMVEPSWKFCPHCTAELAQS